MRDEYQATGDLKGVRSRHEVQIADGPPTPVQQQAEYEYLQRKLAARFQIAGVDEPSKGTWQVMAGSNPVSQFEIDQIRRGNKTIYDLGYVEWTNPSGSRSSTYVCKIWSPFRPVKYGQHV